MVFVFRQVCSLVQMDQGFNSIASLIVFYFAGISLIGGPDALCRLCAHAIVKSQPLSDTSF